MKAINEKEKKLPYNQRAQEVEHGKFNPVVTSAIYDMRRECKKFY